jgi:ketosteroid isomerase-like protein
MLLDRLKAAGLSVDVAHADGARIEFREPPGEAFAGASDVRAALDALVHAELAGDVETLDTLIADDFLGTDAVHGEFTKASILEGYRQGDRVDHHEISDLDVRYVGSTVVMVGRARIRGRTAGGPYEVTMSFMDVWSWRAGGWSLVGAHTVST